MGYLIQSTFQKHKKNRKFEKNKKNTKFEKNKKKYKSLK
tara:strand:- start:1851 stop:1967 length:117 start_codon:yes stop_codon:yes gene_type:complete